MILGGCDSDSAEPGMLPETVHGWVPDGEDGRYDADTLYDYIDGGAEVYRALGVRSVVGRRYVREGAPEIYADVFDMGSAAGAYGAYHHDPREGQPAEIGTESEVQEGALAFWKDRFFVSILAMDTDDETYAAVLEIGRSVDRAIAGSADVPPLVAALPPDGLLADHVRYFRGPMLLNRYVDLGENNPLGLAETTEGVLARYRVAPPDGSEPGGDQTLLVVEYESAERAELGLAGLDRLRAPAGEGSWNGARTRGRFLVAVRGAPAPQAAESSLEDALSRLERQETP